MNHFESAAQLTPSSEILNEAESELIAPYFTNAHRSVVALRNLPESIKGALFSRYSRSTKGVRRLFLDEFLLRNDLGLEEFSRSAQLLRDEVHTGEAKADSFYSRILSDYGDDSVGELGGAHIACQEVSQITAKAIEDSRIGLSYLEKSSRYVPFDDRVAGLFRYYRPHKILKSEFGADYIAAMDELFETYSRHLPRMIEHLGMQYPIQDLEFENALTGEVVRFPAIQDDEFRRSAEFAYKQAVRARACDVLRCFLPMATLTNVGVWGNGRSLEYLLLKLYADSLDEIQTIAHAAQFELDQVIGPFIKRASDAKGQEHQAFLRQMKLTQRNLASEFLECPKSNDNFKKVNIVHFDVNAVDQVVGSILYAASDWSKAEIYARVAELTNETKAEIIRAYVGQRENRRHKPGRAFERAVYEFDLLLNIGEYRDLQRHRMLSADRQMFTTRLGYEVNSDIASVPEIKSDYARTMEQTANLYERLASEMPYEAQYVVPFGFRLRYNVQMNLREAFHWIELRSAPQGHPDYRNTSQEMYHALKAIHPVLVESMTFLDLTPDIPMGRLRAEMRRASKAQAKSQAQVSS